MMLHRIQARRRVGQDRKVVFLLSHSLVIYAIFVLAHQLSWHGWDLWFSQLG